MGFFGLGMFFWNHVFGVDGMNDVAHVQGAICLSTVFVPLTVVRA